MRTEQKPHYCRLILLLEPDESTSASSTLFHTGLRRIYVEATLQF